MGNSKQHILNTLRLSTQEIEELLRTLDSSSLRQQGNPKRGTWRWRLQPQRIIVTISCDGAKTHHIAAARNISAGGVGFLHGGFLYPGCSCLITMRGVDGKARVLHAVVKRCRHVAGRLHEIGAQFEGRVNPRDFFVHYDEDSHLFNQERVDPKTLEGHILIAAKSECVRAAIAAAFDETPVDVECVSSAEAARAALRRRPGLMFAHDDLGELTGIDFVTLVRREGVRLPIILLTDRADQDLRMAAIGCGANEMLFMPCDRHLLLRAAGDYLSRQSASVTDRNAQGSLRSMFVRIAAESSDGLGLAIESGEFDTTAIRELAKSLRHDAAACGFESVVILCQRVLQYTEEDASTDLIGTAVRQLITACEAIGADASTAPAPTSDSSQSEAA